MYSGEYVEMAPRETKNRGDKETNTGDPAFIFA